MDQLKIHAVANNNETTKKRKHAGKMTSTLSPNPHKFPYGSLATATCPNTGEQVRVSILARQAEHIIVAFKDRYGISRREAARVKDDGNLELVPAGPGAVAA